MDCPKCDRADLLFDEPVCPKCDHYNAMLVRYSRDKEWIRECRDCGHEARYGDKLEVILLCPQPCGHRVSIKKTVVEFGSMI